MENLSSLPNDSYLNLPVLRDVDVLVVGATSGAVAAAVEIQSHGQSAMLVSELSYVGEESAGTLNLWQPELDRSDAIVGAMFAEHEACSAFPNEIKRALEAALLQAQIPFLYLARPVALLRDEAGNLTGAILAMRTSLCVVRCRTIMDATRYGVVAKLAGIPCVARPELPPSLSWTVLADGVPNGWDGQVEELQPPYTQQTPEDDVSCGAYRLRVERTTLGDDPRAWEHVVRSLAACGNVLVTADILPDVPAQVCAGTPVDNPALLDDAAFMPQSGILLLNGLLPCTLAGAALLERSDVQVALGRRVGKLAAEAASIASAGTVAAVQTGGEQNGNYSFAPAFLRENEKTLAVPPLAFPLLGRCDVAVAGGGTGGAPAGIAAAREGATTVVVEPQHTLGGVSTVGFIAAYWFGNRVGFTAELDEAVSRIDVDSRENNGRIWRPENKAAIYHRMLQEAGGTAWLGSYAYGVRLNGERVDALLVSTPLGCGVLEAGCVVDATGSADIAAAAGAPCRVIGGDHVAVQGTGLSPRATPKVRMRNSDHTFIDDTDPEGITHAFVTTRAKFSSYFDNSPMVNSRERRQIHGDFEMSPLDILAGRTFPDTICTASSNFDTHGFIIHPLFMVTAPDHDPLQAHVPFRCLLPKGLDGVLVTGLAVSAHRDALPVIRMQADVQNQGYAAGIAATMSAANALPLRSLDIRALQQRLVEIGILAPDVPTHEDSFPMSADAVRAAAEGDLTALMDIAILFAHAKESRPLLLQILHQTTDPARRLQAARILGLQGVSEAAPVLLEAVRDAEWDTGWNYRGMGQFGMSMSQLDMTILALARTGNPAAAAPIAEKVRQLATDAMFSHCRVAALAAALLRDSQLTAAIADLLRQPGMQGHAHLDTRRIVSQANADLTETEPRNNALRELYLARGLFLAGDIDGLGRATLESYTHDLRGHFARHARAVLNGCTAGEMA